MKKIFIYLFLAFSTHQVLSQGILGNGKISGNFQTDAQYYQKDSLIGAEDVEEKMLINAFANIVYTNDKFTAGMRFEMYQNPLVGFNRKYKGSGIPYRYATYNNGDWEVTVGNYYEQFGNGLLFRSYEERNLGFDNAMDGVRFRVTPHQAISIKGIWGNQRQFWDKGEGIVRGLDVDFNMNAISEKMSEMKLKLTSGFSFVSKYQRDQDPIYNLPKNVAGFAGRMGLGYGNFSVNGEYAHKINDPNATNNMIYKPGEALMLNATYSQKGLGILVSALRADNMDFRSDRYVTENALNINYIPSLTRQHAYVLSAFYPYATQFNGQMSYQAQINYKIKKSTKLGGKYGTDVAVNYSRVHDIKKMKIDENTDIDKNGTDGYKSDFFMPGDVLLFEDFNIEIGKRLTSKLKLVADYIYLTYNKSILEGHPGDPTVYAHIGIADLTYRISSNNAMRMEFQHMYTEQDEGNWANVSAEYTISPMWFFGIGDSYNYGNEKSEKRIHYYNASIGVVKNNLRFALTYGKQRKGILCVGGVCREVPASNGLTVTLTGTF
jgi:hypothetical protein